MFNKLNNFLFLMDWPKIFIFLTNYLEYIIYIYAYMLKQILKS